MHDSMRDLTRFKLRSKIYSPLLGVGIIAVAFAIIMGLGKDDPLVIDTHFFLLLLGIFSVFLGMLLHQNEEEFAQKYDMTHICAYPSHRQDEQHQLYCSL